MRRRRRPAKFVVLYELGRVLEELGKKIKPQHKMEALRGPGGRYADQRAVPQTWSDEARENVG